MVLQHIVNHPQKVLVDTPAPNAAAAIELVGEDGTQTIVSLRPAPALPA